MTIASLISLVFPGGGFLFLFTSSCAILSVITRQGGFSCVDQSHPVPITPSEIHLFLCTPLPWARAVCGAEERVGSAAGVGWRREAAGIGLLRLWHCGLLSLAMTLPVGPGRCVAGLSSVGVISGVWSWLTVAAWSRFQCCNYTGYLFVWCKHGPVRN